MKLSIIVLCLGCMVFGNGLVAQQLPQGSLYSLNPFVVNPAMSGAYDFGDLRVSYRKQWQGLEGAPVTGFVSGHSPIAYGNKVRKGAKSPRYAGGPAFRPTPPSGSFRWGLGGIFMYDKTGLTQRNTIQMTAAAHITLPNEWQLSLGGGAGALQYQINFDEITTATANDPLVPDGRVSVIKPYFSAGMMVRKGNFWGGASVLSPRPITLDYGTVSGSSDSRIEPHYFVTASYRVELSQDWAVLPQVWLKGIDSFSKSVDTQVRVQYADRIWGGVHYRVKESMGVQMGLALLANTTLSYAYEYPLSDIRSVSTGSHEILIGIRFNNRSAVFCPPMGW